MSESDDLFTREDPIFVQKELLEINHLPDEGRIVGRDEEIKNLANAVNPAIFGQSPSNVLIYGKPVQESPSVRNTSPGGW